MNLNNDDFNSYQSTPLVVQISGNNPTVLAECMRRLMEYNDNYHRNKNDDDDNNNNNNNKCNFEGPISAIDFNLGCPQDRAKEGKR